jgi:hypothetical protein
VLFGPQKFRQHLHGERFGVVTDHSALVWLMSLRIQNIGWLAEFWSSSPLILMWSMLQEMEAS